MHNHYNACKVKSQNNLIISPSTFTLSLMSQTKKYMKRKPILKFFIFDEMLTVVVVNLVVHICDLQYLQEVLAAEKEANVKFCLTRRILNIFLEESFSDMK